MNGVKKGMNSLIKAKISNIEKCKREFLDAKEDRILPFTTIYTDDNRSNSPPLSGQIAAPDSN